MLTNSAVRAQQAIKAIRTFEMIAYARTVPSRRFSNTTIDIFTNAADGAQNFCIIHEPCINFVHTLVGAHREPSVAIENIRIGYVAVHRPAES